MKTKNIILVVAGLALLGSSAWAQNVTMRGRSPQGGDISVSMPRNKAMALKRTVTKLNRSGAESYLTLWKKVNTRTRSFPSGSGSLLVTNVKNNRQWVDNYGKNTIGFISNGSPQAPGYSGYVRVGDKVFTYSTIRNEHHTHTYATRPLDVRTYRHAHVESTFDATPQQVAAFKAFYLARANGAILNPRTNQPHLPTWNNPGASTWKKEGCAGASTSILNPKWQAAFRHSINNIRQVGQRLGIPEMANASVGMVEAIAAFGSTTKLKQNTTPKNLVRKFALESPVGNKITILNAPGGEVRAPFLKKFAWDQKHARYDNDKGWNGMGAYPMIPDKAQAESRSSSFRNVRLNPLTALNNALTGGGGVTPPAPTGLLNINRATRAQLIALPRIGTSKADRIIQDRQTNGAYTRLQDLSRVKGIGSSTVQLLSSHLSVQ